MCIRDRLSPADALLAPEEHDLGIDVIEPATKPRVRPARAPASAPPHSGTPHAPLHSSPMKAAADSTAGASGTGTYGVDVDDMAWLYAFDSEVDNFL